MKKPETATKPLFFVRPKDGESADALADRIAEVLIEQINASRIAKGLPPLEKR